MSLQTKIISSLGKVFPDEIYGEKLEKATFLKNEPFSFQIAFKNSEDCATVTPVFVRVDTDLEIYCISEYQVGFVPVSRADCHKTDVYYDRKTPGMYPDLLLKRKTNAKLNDDGFWKSRWFEQGQKHILDAFRDSYSALWFTVMRTEKR